MLTRNVKVLLALMKEDGMDEFVKIYVNEIVEVSMRARLTLSEATPELKATKEVASEVLELLEQKIGSAEFIGAYSRIQQVIQSKRSEKKRALAADAVSNPALHAERKVN